MPPESGEVRRLRIGRHGPAGGGEVEAADSDCGQATEQIFRLSHGGEKLLFQLPHGDGPCELHDGQIFRAIAAGAHELVQDKERTQAGILPGGGPRQCSEREIGFVQMKHIEEIADDGAASSLFAAKSAG